MGLLNAASAAISVALTGFVYLYVCLKSWAGAFGIGAVIQICRLREAARRPRFLHTVHSGMCANASFLKWYLTFSTFRTACIKAASRLKNVRITDMKLSSAMPQLSVSRFETYALKDVSLIFQTGERFAVVGMNGSGKTTFIRLLCRLYDPTEGEILLNGVNIQKMTILNTFQFFLFQLSFRILSYLLFRLRRMWRRN